MYLGGSHRWVLPLYAIIQTKQGQTPHLRTQLVWFGSFEVRCHKFDFMFRRMHHFPLFDYYRQKYR